MNQRTFFRSLCRTAAVFAADQLLHAQNRGVQFINIARESRLKAETIYGREARTTT